MDKTKKHKFKKEKLYKIIWITGLYVILIIILWLVIEYKVKWESADLNRYVRFYNCSGSLCTTEENITKYYSKLVCSNNCPRIIEIINDKIAILAINNKELLYNYIDGNIINEEYSEYMKISDELFIVTKDNKKGIINIDGNTILSSIYDDIKEYKDNVLTVNTLNKWGIVNLEDGSKIEPFYNSINIINSKKFIVELNDKYFLINEKEQELTDIKYDYMYYIDNYIVAIYNNKIDILNENLDSKLIMKIFII